MTMEEGIQKMREMRKELDHKGSELFFLRAEKNCLKLRMRGVTEKLKEFSQKGDLKAISYKLEAGQQGMFSDKQVLRDMLECVANNVHAKAA